MKPPFGGGKPAGKRVQTVPDVPIYIGNEHASTKTLTESVGALSAALYRTLETYSSYTPSTAERREHIAKVMLEAFLVLERHGEIYDKKGASAILERLMGESLRVRGSSTRRSEYVYLIKADNGLCKIGKSSRVKSRFRALQSASPAQLELVHKVKTDNAIVLEMRLHKRFASSRKHGEWFALTDQDVAYIKSLSDVVIGRICQFGAG